MTPVYGPDKSIEERNKEIRWRNEITNRNLEILRRMDEQLKPGTPVDLKRQYYLDKRQIESVEDCIGIYITTMHALGLLQMMDFIQQGNLQAFAQYIEALFKLIGPRIDPNEITKHLYKRDDTYDNYDPQGEETA